MLCRVPETQMAPPGLSTRRQARIQRRLNWCLSWRVFPSSQAALLTDTILPPLQDTPPLLRKYGGSAKTMSTLSALIFPSV